MFEVNQLKSLVHAGDFILDGKALKASVAGWIRGNASHHAFELLKSCVLFPFRNKVDWISKEQTASSTVQPPFILRQLKRCYGWRFELITAQNNPAA